MSRFVTEPNEQIPLASEAPPPTTLGGLLGDLGVFDRSRDAQREAVMEWLRKHEPHGDVMREQMIRRGYITRDGRRAA